MFLEELPHNNQTSETSVTTSFDFEQPEEEVTSQHSNASSSSATDETVAVASGQPINMSQWKPSEEVLEDFQSVSMTSHQRCLKID